jgi:hypothetical protein
MGFQFSFQFIYNKCKGKDVSLYFIKQHIMKMYGGVEVAPSILNLGSRWR